MKTKLLAASLFLLLITSCQAKTEQTPEIVDECIPPLESFVYSSFPNLETIPGEEGMVIPPNWEIERDITNSILMSRKIDQEVELWFADAPEPKKSFWIYKPESKQEWYVSGEIENSGVYIKEIFTDSNGAIWGLTNFEFFENHENIQQIPLLSRLNEKTRAFEFIDVTKKIPYTVHEDDPTYSWYWTTMLIDHDNLIWFLVPNDYVYVYNPTENTLEKTIPLEELMPYQASLAPNGDIYFSEVSSLMEKGIVKSSRDTRVFKIDVENQQIEQVPVRLDPWPPYAHILIDHEGKIWLDALGFINNEEGILYQLEKSPIFLTPVFFSGLDYRWTTPEIYMESSDGKLWFRSLNGTAWLDLDEQKWCWLTTSSFKVIEDADHNLWTTAYGKLYRKKIEPEF